MILNKLQVSNLGSTRLGQGIWGYTLKFFGRDLDDNDKILSLAPLYKAYKTNLSSGVCGPSSPFLFKIRVIFWCSFQASSPSQVLQNSRFQRLVRHVLV